MGVELLFNIEYITLIYPRYTDCEGRMSKTVKVQGTM